MPDHFTALEPKQIYEDNEVRIVHIIQPPVDTLRVLSRLDRDMQEHFREHSKPYKKGYLYK